ncbi:hypothetical protein [Variovorax sp. J31P207]|uniref:hypothetical protein n=1 Tax=Variovorax sp. J31P207 TaxID=3053510 RepID=UPI002576E2D9|nr:hypothetical protein [Variovorax sp. J31P207]MDM0066913.1 hypothetical protein [Variovorax sp. J31P207]
MESTEAGADVMVRGLRYDDKWRRVGGTSEAPVWQIEERIHLPLWQYLTVTTAPGLPAKK